MAALKRFCSDRTLFHKYKNPNISNNTGLSPVRFFESKVSLVNFKIRIQDYDNTNNRKDASFEFSDIKPGKYAIAVIHDENCNGKLDTNMFGIPKEGYGFSSGAEVTMSAPSFSDAVFSYGRTFSNFNIS
jgi:uncharacterized protein (DUF2141 family)